MAPKTSWHRCGTKLRRCRPMYTHKMVIVTVDSVASCVLCNAGEDVVSEQTDEAEEGLPQVA